MPDIVVEAGLSVGSLYHYFAGKEELFVAVVADRVALYTDAFFAKLQGGGAACDRIWAAFQQLHSFLEDQSPLDARLSLELWARAHDVVGLREWLRQARSRRVQALREVLNEGRRSGALRSDVDINDAAAALLALADGMVVRRACAPFSAESGQALSGVHDLLIGWRVAECNT